MKCKEDKKKSAEKVKEWKSNICSAIKKSLEKKNRPCLLIIMGVLFIGLSFLKIYFSLQIILQIILQIVIVNFIGFRLLIMYISLQSLPQIWNLLKFLLSLVVHLFSLESFLMISGIVSTILGIWLLIRLKKERKLNKISKENFEYAIFEMKKKELFIFIKIKFWKNKNKSVVYFKDIFEQLVSLDSTSLDYGIARMKIIEEESDIKSIPYILTLIGVMLPYYKLVLDNVKTTTKTVSEDGMSTAVVMLIYTLFIALFISRTIDKLKEKTRKALYFRTLLESAKVIKKERETTKKNQLKEEIEQVKEEIEQVKEEIEQVKEEIEQVKKKKETTKKKTVEKTNRTCKKRIFGK